MENNSNTNRSFEEGKCNKRGKNIPQAVEKDTEDRRNRSGSAGSSCGGGLRLADDHRVQAEGT